MRIAVVVGGGPAQREEVGGTRRRGVEQVALGVEAVLAQAQPEAGGRIERAALLVAEERLGVAGARERALAQAAEEDGAHPGRGSSRARTSRSPSSRASSAGSGASGRAAAARRSSSRSAARSAPSTRASSASGPVRTGARRRYGAANSAAASEARRRHSAAGSSPAAATRSSSCRTKEG